MKLDNSRDVIGSTRTERYSSLAYGLVSHAAFASAVSLMIYSLFSGFQFGCGTFTGPWRWVVNTALILQFPILHSLLLARVGTPLLDAIAPPKLAVRLRPTTYVLVASLQLLAVFVGWSPGSRIFWIPSGTLYYVHCFLFATSWMLLGKAMWDGHLGIQTGYIGWTSIWRGERSIRWPGLPTTGLFRVCRQPIYFSFMLTLWTGPVWSVDKLAVALLWTIYCYFGPILKEARMSKRFGAGFAEYKARIPYYWPRWR